MKKLSGIVAAMVTPFDDRGAVDHHALRAQTDFLIGRGVGSLFVCGTTGEAHLLSAPERMRIAETVLGQAAGRAIVYVQAECGDVACSIQLANHAKQHGADGIALLTPTYFRYSDRELEDYLVAIASALDADFPIYLYSIPQYATNGLSPACVRGIVAKCPNVVGLKYSGGKMGTVDAYLRTVPGIDVMMGSDSMILPGLAMGCKGAVSGPSSAFPEPYLALYDAFQRGDLPEARRLQAVANNFADALSGMDGIARFKAMLTLRGVPGGGVRAPRQALSDDEIKVLQGVMDGLKDFLR